jgi:hypothetical protein
MGHEYQDLAALDLKIAVSLTGLTHAISLYTS